VNLVNPTSHPFTGYVGTGKRVSIPANSNKVEMLPPSDEPIPTIPPITLDGAAPDLSAWYGDAGLHWHCRWVRPGLVFDLWLEVHEGQHWGHAELLVTATAESARWELDMLPKLVSGGHLLLRQREALLLFHGQAMAVCGVWVLDKALADPEQMRSAMAWWEHPMLPVQDHLRHGHRDIAAPLDREKLSALWEAHGTWRHIPLGPNARSGDTGAQEDQGWHAQHGLLDSRDLLARYLAALQMARRPNGFRESDGRPIDLANHPQLVLWDGRPHWSRGVSPDQLGLAQQVMEWSGGYMGPDREHWLLNTLCETYEQTRSPLLRQLIEDQRTLILGGETLDPRLSTSNAGAPRGVGWTCLAAAKVYVALDKDEEVRERMAQRLRQVIVPQCLNPGYEVKRFATVTDDRVLGGKTAWVPWQHSIAAMGLWAAYRAMQLDEAMWLALAAADAVTRYGWSQVDGVWIAWDAIEEREPGVPGTERFTSGFFKGWMQAGPSVVIAAHRMALPVPEDLVARAQAILDAVEIAPRWRVPGS